MKGTTFQKPLEFKLAVEGESWSQGDAISGSLTLKNHGTDVAGLSSVRIVLAYGDLEDVRLKVADAFTVLSTTELKAVANLAPGQEETFPWKIETDRNCPITDKSKSLFLLYGQGDGVEKLGHLQLVMHPVAVIREFFDLMSIDFKFVVKILKFNKGCVEAKFTPPSSKAFSAVENLFISFKFEGQELQLKYLFNVKKLDASAGMAMKKEKKDFIQALTRSDYMLSSGHLNHEKMNSSVQSILDELGATELL